MADVSLTAVEDQIFVTEGPQPTVVGESLTLDITYPWTTTMDTPTNAIYKEDTATDLSTTHLSGSTTITGNVLTTKVISGLVANERYVLAMGCRLPATTGDTIIRKVLLICQGAGDGA